MSNDTQYREIELEAWGLWHNALARARHNGTTKEPNFDSLILATMPECRVMLELYNQATGREESDLPGEVVEQVRHTLKEVLDRHGLKVAAKTSRSGTILRLEPAT